MQKRTLFSLLALTGILGVQTSLVHALPLADYTTPPVASSVSDLLNYYTDDLSDVSDNVSVPYAYTDFDITIDKTADGYWPGGTGFVTGTYTPTNTTMPVSPMGLEVGDYVLYEIAVDAASIGGTNDYTPGAQDIQVYLPNIYDVFASGEFTLVEFNYDQLSYDSLTGEAQVTNQTFTTGTAAGVVTDTSAMNETNDAGGAVVYDTDLLIENLDPNNPVVTVVLEVAATPAQHLDEYSNGVYHETDITGTTEFEDEVETPVKQDFNIVKEVTSITRNGTTIFDSAVDTVVPTTTDGDIVTYDITIDPTTVVLGAGYTVYDVFEESAFNLISANTGTVSGTATTGQDVDGDGNAEETLITFTGVSGTDTLTVVLEIDVQ